jgi:hypothetical protein
MIRLLLILLMMLCIFCLTNKKETFTNEKSKNYDFYIKWITDKPDLVKKYGKEYLLMLTNPIFSKISKLPEEIKKYPNIVKAKSYKIILNKGDSIFIPAGWWHYIISHDRNIAINNWYIPYHKNVLDEEWRKTNNFKLDRIESIDNSLINKDIFNQYVKKSTPLVIKNIANDWPCISNWMTNEYLIEKISDTKVQYYKFDKTSFWNKAWRRTNKDQILTDSFDKLINLIVNNTNNYYYLARNYDIAKILNNDYKNIDFAVDLEHALANVWINYGSINCPLHYDMFDNILTQIDGKKEIYLFAPFDDQYLYVDTK